MNSELKALQTAAKIRKNGHIVQLVRSMPDPTPPAVNPADPDTLPWRQAPVLERGPANEAATDVAVLTLKYEDKDIDGDAIRADDWKMMMEAVSPAPQTGERIESAKGSYRIVNAVPFEPAGIPIYYDVQARK